MHDFNSTLASTFSLFSTLLSLFSSNKTLCLSPRQLSLQRLQIFFFQTLLSSTNFGESVVYNSEVTDSMSVISVFMQQLLHKFSFLLKFLCKDQVLNIL